MKRVAIGGWQHETNTFAPSETDFRAFEMADAWPALVEGPPFADTQDNPGAGAASQRGAGD